MKKHLFLIGLFFLLVSALVNGAEEKKILVGGHGLGEQTEQALQEKEKPPPPKEKEEEGIPPEEEEVEIKEEEVEEEAQTEPELDTYLAGVGKCSPEVSAVEIKPETGKIKLCDNQGKSLENQVRVSLKQQSSDCDTKEVCITLWRINPVDDLPARDIDGGSSVSSSERLYYSLLYWLYRTGMPMGLWPAGTDQKEAFEVQARKKLVDLRLFDREWFKNNTHTKCFSSSQELKTSISKKNSFLNPDIGKLRSPVYLTVQLRGEQNGKINWFISKNLTKIPVDLTCKSAEEEEIPPEEGEEIPPEEGEEIVSIPGPEPPEEYKEPGEEEIIPISAPEPPEEYKEPGEEKPPSMDLKGCNPCSSVIGCLACIDYALVYNAIQTP